jgi:transposase
MHSNLTLAGIDVSKAKLEVCATRDGRERQGTFDNDETGTRALIKWLGKNARICLEATGVYHLPLCLALRRAGIEVMVINPRVARDFARAKAVRSKTDRVDAAVLLDYLRRMEFVAWIEPAPELLELRDMARRIEDLSQAAADEKNRRHALRAAGASRTVVRDVEVNLAHLDRRLREMQKNALRLIRAHAWLGEKLTILKTVGGVGDRTAIYLMAELLPLDPTMTVREIVAYAGLDPRHEESGTSIHKPARISRVGNARLRRILFLPALTLGRSDPFATHFKQRLIDRGKKKMQAIVALMRKLLHGVWVVLQRNTPFDSAKLFPLDAAELERNGHLAVAESSDSATAATQPEPRRGHPKGRSEAEERQLDASSAEATPARHVA